jgi:hypothetical protein
MEFVCLFSDFKLCEGNIAEHLMFFKYSSQGRIKKKNFNHLLYEGLASGFHILFWANRKIFRMERTDPTYRAWHGVSGHFVTVAYPSGGCK